MRLLRSFDVRRQQREIDALYALLYRLTHDLDESVSLGAAQTQDAFATQWKDLPEGNYLLSDPWFRDNVARIISEEELQVRDAWFRGKDVLDAGCGNGRWSYGLAQLGANVTAVDVNHVAIDATKKALEGRGDFRVTPLEDVASRFPSTRFDLVWCWGVLHHCRSFNRSLAQVASLVKPGGAIYLYLYGRESHPFPSDLELFKERVRFNSLATAEERLAFLRQKARGVEADVHVMHDLYAPLVNRRLDWPFVKDALEKHGFSGVDRTIDHTEIFVRAFRGEPSADLRASLLPKKAPPYWFRHHG